MWSCDGKFTLHQRRGRQWQECLLGPQTFTMSPSLELLTAVCQNSSTASRPSSLSTLLTWSKRAAPCWSGVHGGKRVRSSARRSRNGLSSSIYCRPQT